MTIKPVYIIAEAGVNHNGCIDKAISLIDIAVDAGANAVKFQSFSADKLVTPSAPKARYQTKQTPQDETQYDMLKKLELSHDNHILLRDYCYNKPIDFLSTPFDIDGITMLTDTLGLSMLKIGSGDITNGPYLLHAARKATHLIVSTGASSLSDIYNALAVILWGKTHQHVTPPSWQAIINHADSEGFASLHDNVSLLHCVSQYPAPYEQLNLCAMHAMRDTFGLNVGFSDHSVGIEAPLLATAMGAHIIEKHYTIDKTMIGPDHAASLNPEELTQMIVNIRNAEIMLGKSDKALQACEYDNVAVIRKSLVAATAIKKGDILQGHNVASKRPAYGLSPMQYWDIINKESPINYDKDDILQ